MESVVVCWREWRACRGGWGGVWLFVSLTVRMVETCRRGGDGAFFTTLISAWRN